MAKEKQKFSFINIAGEKRLRIEKGKRDVKVDKSPKANPKFGDVYETDVPNIQDNFEVFFSALLAEGDRTTPQAALARLKSEGEGWLPPRHVINGVKKLYHIFTGEKWVRVEEGTHWILVDEERAPR